MFPKSRSLKSPIRSRYARCAREAVREPGPAFLGSRTFRVERTTSDDVVRIMPGCRKSVPFLVAPTPLRSVSLSHYVTHGRMPVRACNDNGNLHNLPIWRMALAICAVPVASALVILSILM